MTDDTIGQHRTRDVLDPARFERLVDEHGSRVHGYLARRAPHDADDLLAEVWLAAYAARHRFDPGAGDVGGWLVGIARNVLLAHQRSRRRHERRPGLVEPDVDGWAAVDARLDADRAAPRLRAALADLPPEEREVLLLVAWEQLTPSEAAGVLGIPPGTARSRLHRARSRLTTGMSADPDSHEPSPCDPEREAVR